MFEGAFRRDAEQFGCPLLRLPAPSTLDELRRGPDVGEAFDAVGVRVEGGGERALRGA